MKPVPRLLALVYMVLGSILASCNNPELESDPVAGSALPDILGAHSLSEHYVVISFADPAEPQAGDASRYEIRAPDSQSLAILKAELSLDRRRVVIATGAQQPVMYTLNVDNRPVESNVLFLGSVEREPTVESAISLSNTEILVTFSTQMDRTTAENAAFYEISTASGDGGAGIRITGVALSDDYTTVVLTTTPQEHVEYVIRVTNVRRRFSCEDGGRIFLDDAAQGPVCAGNFRPLTPEHSLTDFVITARTQVDRNDISNADAVGNGGSVTTDFNGAGVKPASCTGANDGISGGTGPDDDEELIFVPDTSEVAENIVLGVRSLDFDDDEPMIFLSSDHATGYDFTIGTAEIQSAFNTGVNAGDIVFANFPSLPPGLMVDMIKLRETDDELWVHSICGLSTGGRLIDPTRSTASFVGIPPIDTDGPQVVRVLSINDTTLLVQFSEPLSGDAADPTHYLILPPVNTSAAQVPPLAVTAVELAAHDTQAILTTLPQVAGAVYRVQVTGVTDKSGNSINVSANSATFSFVGGPGSLGAGTLPRVVGAASAGNTSVMIVFSKPMGDSALAAGNYFIVQQNVTPEAGYLGIVDSPTDSSDDPHFLDSGRTAVLLTTLSQNEIVYVITAVNVKDQSGNQLAPPELLVNPSVAVFAGTPFSCGGKPCDLPDSDGDGLSDFTEQRGWVVTVHLSNGEISQRDVTSDPFSADTDADGLDDRLENALVSNPRSTDTDGDQLSDNDEFNVHFSDPVNQDSDEDGIDDGLEVGFYRSSPILDDTDGDGFTDAEEVIEFNRNPRIADLPRPSISVGNMRILIDERYTTTTEQGENLTLESSSNTTLSQSEDRSFASSETDVTSNSRDIFVKAGLELEFSKSFVPDVTVSAEAGVTWKSHSEHTTQFSQESTISAQQTHEQSLAKGQSLSMTTAVTREVAGARVDVDLTIRNEGDIAFAITNLEISMLQSTGLSRTDFVPVGTLVPNTALITGAVPTFNLGPFTAELGPFIFGNRDIFPSEVDDLLREPRGLIFRIANYDVVDEFGRNFAFASQTARDRTAGLTIDFGDGTVDRFLVATAGAFDVEGFVGGGFVGGFDSSNGLAVGLPVDFILQDTLGLTKNGTVPDGILAGADGVANSLAQGDDIQLIPLGTTGLPDDAVVISAGENGVLDTAVGAGDESEIITGYATSPTCSAETTRIFDPNDPDILLDGPGFACESDADCPGPGTCTGREVLVRMRNRRLGDFNRVWAVFSSGQIPAGADFSQIVLRPGDDLTLAFIQDLDRDGLFAQEEYLYGSSDRDQDSDKDVIGDFAEVRVGWEVGVIGAEKIRRVLPDPRVPDSDGDRLEDLEEQDLRRLFCRCTGGGAMSNDGDACGEDATCDGACTCGAIYRCAGGPDNGLGCSSSMSCRPSPIANAPVCSVDSDCAAGQVCNGGLCATAVACTQDASAGAPTISAVFGGASPADGPIRSDPRSRDTDDDGVFDMDEIAGYLIGVSVRDPNPSTGISQTQALSDDIQKVFVGQPVGPSGVVVLPGPNGRIDSACNTVTLACGGNDVLFAGTTVFTNPLNPDDDGDTRPDGQERDAGSEPTNPNDSDDFIDSDRDGLSDAAEEDATSGGWDVETFDINGHSSGVVHVFSSKFVADTDFDGLPDFLERELRTDPTRDDTDNDGLNDYDEFADFASFVDLSLRFPGFLLDGTGSLATGTNALDQDTDNDGLDDRFEAISGWSIVVGGEVKFVTSDPLIADTDLDGASDRAEFLGEGGTPPPVPADATDPRDPDTDDDGVRDGLELAAGGSDPLVPDLVVGVRILRLVVEEAADPGDAEVLWAWKFTAELAGVSAPVELSSSALYIACFPGSFPSEPTCQPSTGLIFPSPGSGNSTISFNDGVDFTACTAPERLFAMREGQALRLNFKLDSPNSAAECDPFNQVVECAASANLAISFSTLLSAAAWQEQEVDLGLGGVQACTNSKVTVQILRH